MFSGIHFLGEHDHEITCALINGIQLSIFRHITQDLVGYFDLCCPLRKKREQSEIIDNQGRKLDKACIRFSQYVPGMSNGTDTWIAIAKLD